jgi:tetratricopeptide (TPR) repeat protein
MNNLSVVLQERARYRESEPLERALLVAKRRFIGSETVPVAITLGNLGAVLAHLGRHPEAEEAFRSAHALFVKLLGAEHTHVANAARNLARIHLLQGDNAAAVRWFREAVEVHRKANGSDAGYWFMRGQAAVAASRTGRAARAIPELRLVLDRLIALGVPPARTSDARIALGFVLLDSGKHAEATALFRESLEMRRKEMPADHPAIAEAECGFGAALATQGEPEGRRIVEHCWSAYKAWGLADPVYLARTRASLQLP